MSPTLPLRLLLPLLEASAPLLFSALLVAGSRLLRQGLDLAKRFVDELLVSAKFYMEFYDYARSDFEETCHYIFYVADILKQNGDTEEGEAMEKSLDDLVSSVAE